MNKKNMKKEPAAGAQQPRVRSLKLERETLKQITGGSSLIQRADKHPTAMF